jgi:hypothetical protein
VRSATTDLYVDQYTGDIAGLSHVKKRGQSHELAGILRYRIPFQPCLSKRPDKVGCADETRSAQAQLHNYVPEIMKKK